MLISGNKTANIYVKKTVQFIETLCKGDIVVTDIKQQRFTFTPLQNFQLHRYTLSVGFFWLCITEKLEISSMGQSLLVWHWSPIQGPQPDISRSCKTTDMGPVCRIVACLLLSFHWHQFILLGDRRIWVWTRVFNPGIPGIPAYFLNPESRDWRCFNPGISGLQKLQITGR